jgi:hypothetical protein
LRTWEVEVTTFFIAPFKPTEWRSAGSELRIDPGAYREQLSLRWPDTEFLSSSGDLLLEWSLFARQEDGSRIPLGIGGLHSDRQVVSMDTPEEGFFLWHRGVIPREHKLFLFSGGSMDSLEITVDTTLVEIEEFVGKRQG